MRYDTSGSDMDEGVAIRLSEWPQRRVKPSMDGFGLVVTLRRYQHSVMPMFRGTRITYFLVWCKRSIWPAVRGDRIFDGKSLRLVCAGGTRRRRRATLPARGRQRGVDLGALAWSVTLVSKVSNAVTRRRALRAQHGARGVDRHVSNPSRTACTPAAVREDTCIFERIDATCLFTVYALIPSASAISLSAKPRLT